MNDIPAWTQDAPPADEGSYGGGGAPRSGGNQPQRGGGYRRREAMAPADAARLASEFNVWLEDRDVQAELKQALPDHIDLGTFIATAKQAVMTKPDLLKEELRASLLRSVARAAAIGLLPDGKQGALVARYDTEAGGYAVTFQPMVGGIIKLGRETGAIKSIRAEIAFRGEHFRVVAGDEDRYEHLPDLEIVDEAYAALNKGVDNHGNPLADADQFMQRVYASYAIITGTDGTVTKRYMTRQRIISLRQSSKASKGPWNSRFIDEMIRKGVILFTAKWINLDVTSAPARRFMDALMTDQEINFDAIAAPEAQHAAAGPARLAPPNKLDGLEMAMDFGRTREKVPVDEPADDAHEHEMEADKSDADVPPASDKTADLPADGVPAPSAGDPMLQTSTKKADVPLPVRVERAVTAIDAMGGPEIRKLTASANYRAFIKDLTDASMFDEMGRISRAVSNAMGRD